MLKKIFYVFLLCALSLPTFASKGSEAVISPEALRTALIIAKKLKSQGKLESPVIAIVDFSKATDTPRFEIYNIDTGEVILSTYVAHGSGSGMGRFATSFSNINGSKQSSLGVYKTLSTYTGHNGRSLQIQGLEAGFNSNALSRSVVIHGSTYVGPGKTGHSWGCFALPSYEAQHIIDILQNGHTLIAYANDSNWLQHSRYING